MASWVCARCTFENAAAAAPVCMMCDMPRGRGASFQSASSAFLSSGARPSGGSSAEPICIDDDDDDCGDESDDDREAKRLRAAASPPPGAAADGAGAAADGASAGGASGIFTPWRVLWTEGLGNDSAAANEHAVRFRDIVRGPQMDWVVLSNYLVDAFWLASVWPALETATKVVLFSGDAVNQPGKLPKHATVYNMKPSNLKTFPNADKKNSCHHAKFILIGYPPGPGVSGGLRFICSTANLIWPDVHSKTQGVYVQDFPFKVGNGSSPFEESLVDYLESLEEHHKLGDGAIWPGAGDEPLTLARLVRRYDFSEAFADLVPCVPGNHSGDKFGHAKLQRLISDDADLCRALAQENWRLVLQFSSFASFKGEYKVELLRALQTSAQTLPHCIVWPTVAEVRDSVDGYVAGTCIPAAFNNVASADRGELRRWTGSASPFIAARKSAVPHLKCYTMVSEDGTRVAWSCVTSANISSYAWGKWTKATGKFKCGHWELGCFFSPRTLRNRPSEPFSCNDAPSSRAAGPPRNAAGSVVLFTTKATAAQTAATPSRALIPLPFDAEQGYDALVHQPWFYDPNRADANFPGGADRFGRTGPSNYNAYVHNRRAPD
ncbi:tyrosyl-DNA phosphodiesterase-domain-containing protein [Pelagophyceae sp. CCMP2097]|nr:tyrosyl-DNA phosphodiesterase-domain-containing protein [Pelagophyceae sp. CCMP2097]